MATPTFNFAAATSSASSGLTTLTLGSFSANAGSNRFLEVWIGIGTGGTPAAPSSVTWGGSSLSIRGSGQAVSSNWHHCKYYLKEADFPGGATGDIVVTWAYAHDEMALAAMVHSDVDQTNPYRNASQVQEVDSATNSPSISVTSDAADVVTAGCFAVMASASISGVANTTGTERADTGIIAGGYENLSCSTLPGAATAVITWAVSNSGTTNASGLQADSLQGAAAEGGSITLMGQAVM
jgi:hypothetical protein